MIGFFEVVEVAYSVMQFNWENMHGMTFTFIELTKLKLLI